MRFLLDSHVFLWWLQDSPKLGRGARSAIASPVSSVFVSAASIWELSIKLGLGKLRYRQPTGTSLDSSISLCGFVELPVTARHAVGVRDLALVHGDPFDRLLISQALAEGLRIVTSDSAFQRYGVPVLAAAS